MIVHNIFPVLMIMEVSVDTEVPKDFKVARLLGNNVEDGCPGCYPSEGSLWF